MRPLHRNAFPLQKRINVVPFLEEISALDRLGSIAWHNKSAAGGWSSLTVKSEEGRDCAFLPAKRMGEPTAVYVYTKLGEQCPRLRSFLDNLGSKVFLVRVLKLRPGELVKFHTDEVAFQDVTSVVRLHLPLTTNPECVLRFGIPLRRPLPGYNVWDARQVHETHIPPGELWFTNVNALHSVYNGGKTDRMHLVIDAAPQPALADALKRWSNSPARIDIN